MDSSLYMTSALFADSANRSDSDRWLLGDARLSAFLAASMLALALVPAIIASSRWTVWHGSWSKAASDTNSNLKW